MFDSPAKLKNFIIWCQKNKVKAFKNKDIEFELSEIAFVPEVQDYSEIPLNDQKTFSDLDGMTEEEREELLYWSSGQKPSQG